MKIPVNKQFRKLNKIRLQPTEKQEIKKAVVLYMRQNPASSDALSVNAWQAFTESWIFGRQSKLVVSSLLIAILLVAGTAGTALAADRAKPGDILFPIDTALEKVELALTKPEKKAEVRLSIAEERVQEITDLVNDFKKTTPAPSDEQIVDQPQFILISTTTPTSTDNTKKNKNQDNISSAVHKTLSTLQEVRDKLSDNNDKSTQEAVKQIIRRLEKSINDLPDDVKVKIGDENEELEYSQKEDEKNERKINVRYRQNNTDQETDDDRDREKNNTNRNENSEDSQREDDKDKTPTTDRRSDSDRKLNIFNRWTSDRDDN